jgi:hypothetical protein
MELTCASVPQVRVRFLDANLGTATLSRTSKKFSFPIRCLLAI